MRPARIIFVPGMKPKPPPDLHARELIRCLAAGLARVRPRLGNVFAEYPDLFTLVPWTFSFYGSQRDIVADRPGIERIIAQPEATPEDVREIDTLARRFSQLLHVLGDAVPFLGRLIAKPQMRIAMAEARRYLNNRRGVSTEIRAMLKAPLREAWQADQRVLLIAHSMGSVIAYDALWELSYEETGAGDVDVFVSMGSPLATRFMRKGLRGADRASPERYPTIIRRWENFSAKGDRTAIHPELRPFFQEMIDLSLTEAIVDHTDFYNPYRGHMGLNVHMSYGYLVQPALAKVIAEWLEEK